MIFHKASSFGNDFIVIEREELAGEEAGGLARRLCDRQRGVGADGVVYFSRRAGGADFRIYNRDGGAAELSGNGMAALAAVLLRRRLAAAAMTLRSGVGARRVALLERRGPGFCLDVEIGRPEFSARSFFPFLKAGQQAYPAAGVEFHPVSVGNPHAVVVFRRPPGPMGGRPLGGPPCPVGGRPLGGLPAVSRLIDLGRKLEGHALFPKRVNVEFVQVTAPGRCRAFFYERGVGPTQASSTGSAAVFAVLRRMNLAGDHLAIEGAAAAAGAEDGPIHLDWRDGIHVRIVTRLICRGEYFAEELERKKGKGKKARKSPGGRQ